MIYGYMRVSTSHQIKGNSLEEQARLLKQNGATVVFQDAYTGTSTDRPNFNKLLTIATEGDTIVITKLDRFARNTIEGIKVVQHLLKKGVKVNILNMGMVDNTPSGTLILTVMLAFAQFERDMIIQRTAEGKAIARTKENFTEGRPQKYSHETVEYALELLEHHSFTQVSKMTGISKSTLYRFKNQKPNGKNTHTEKEHEKEETEKENLKCEEIKLDSIVILK